jgi:hypothetical protein
MAIEDFSAKTNIVQPLELPDDFARNVIVKARAVQRHRRIQRRVLAVTAVMFLAALGPLINHRPSQVRGLAENAKYETLASYRQEAADQTDALRIAEAMNPGAVDDYLMPNTSVLTQFASTYSAASWDDDHDWTANADTSVGS